MIHVSEAISYNNGIEFASNTYCVRFESCPNTSKVFLRKNTSSKALDFIFKIPLIRGGFLLMVNKSLFIILLLGIIPDIFFMLKAESKIKVEGTIPIFAILLIALSFAILLFIKKILVKFNVKDQYHGAEHKVINTNYQGKALTFENCRKASCTSERCGTMHLILMVFTWFILVIIDSFFKITIWPSIKFMLAFIISYELFLMNTNTPILCWLFKLSYPLQKTIFLLEPNDTQLKQAIESFQLLERAETGKIPEEELQELLQNGKNLNI